jgi:hypothetical protein
MKEKKYEPTEKPVKSYRVTIIALSGIILGIGLFPISERIDNHIVRLVIEHLASIFIAVFTLHLFSDWFLKKEMIEIIRYEISDSIHSALPNSFKEIKKSGIVDVYERLNFEKLNEHLAQITKTEIVFLTMWVPYIPHIKEALVDAVNNRKCTVRLLIFNPKSESTIRHRANSLKKGGFTGQTIQTYIDLNRQELIAAYNEIEESKKNSFQCRYYDEWVSIAMYGYGDELLIGHYLINKLSTETPYLKVAGKDKELYKEFHNHFDEVWRRSLEDKDNDIFLAASKEINQARE